VVKRNLLELYALAVCFLPVGCLVLVFGAHWSTARRARMMAA
jgi:hypothetical protein